MSARRANAPYLQVDVLGRGLVNVYRTRHRHDGLNPVVQTINEQGSFDVSRGLFIHIGRVGAVIAWRFDGPARKRAARRGGGRA